MKISREIMAKRRALVKSMLAQNPQVTLGTIQEALLSAFGRRMASRSVAQMRAEARSTPTPRPPNP